MKCHRYLQPIPNVLRVSASLLAIFRAPLLLDIFFSPRFKNLAKNPARVFSIHQRWAVGVEMNRDHLCGFNMTRGLIWAFFFSSTAILAMEIPLLEIVASDFDEPHLAFVRQSLLYEYEADNLPNLWEGDLYTFSEPKKLEEKPPESEEIVSATISTSTTNEDLDHFNESLSSSLKQARPQRNLSEPAKVVNTMANSDNKRKQQCYYSHFRITKRKTDNGNPEQSGNQPGPFVPAQSPGMNSDFSTPASTPYSEETLDSPDREKSRVQSPQCMPFSPPATPTHVYYERPPQNLACLTASLGVPPATQQTSSIAPQNNYQETNSNAEMALYEKILRCAEYGRGALLELVWVI